LNVLKRKISQKDSDFGYRMAKGYFEDFRALQKEFKLSDAQLVEAVAGKRRPGAERERPSEMEKKIREWDYII